MKQHLIEAAKAVALTSEGCGRGRYRIGAIIFDRKGRILAAKTNSYRTHPITLRYHDYPFLHAEAAAIVARGLDNCDGLQLLAVRLKRTHETKNQFTMACPCNACFSLLRDVGISRVFWTDWNGRIDYVNL